MKILFIADNRTRENWGCRATSIALKELMQQHTIIGTIYGDITHNYVPLKIKKSYTKFNKLYSRLYNLSFIKKISFYIDPYNIIKATISDSYKAYQKVKQKECIYKDIDNKIKEADAIVLNGEGTFIFSTPHRYDTIFYLLMLKVAQSYGKKTYCLNSMFSDSPSSKRNLTILQESINIFEQCTMVTARDPLSYEYYKKNISNKIEYVPDALFTWSKYAKYKDICKKYPLALIPFPELDKYWIDFSFDKPYICLSGSSHIKNPQEAIPIYCKLANKLKEKWNLIIIATCAGDQFLETVAQKVNVPFIPVHTNILAGMSILANAKVFISGRWHPSILASNYGTPCVFLGSNSHKTMALQIMLEYTKKHEYSALPNDNEIKQIIGDTEILFKESNKLRLSIEEQSKKLADLCMNKNQIYLHI